MRSHFLILCISTITFKVSGMLIPQQPLCHRNPSLIPQLAIPNSTIIVYSSENIHDIKDPCAAPTRCQNRCAPTDNPLMRAIEQGDSKPVIEHFTSWRRWVEPWHYHDHDIAITLQHAVGFPAEKTGEIVAFLLPQLSLLSNDIHVNAACLFQNAIINGHINVVSALNTQLPELAHSKLMDTLVCNKPNHNTRHSPVDIALQGFNNQDDEAMTHNRLFILREILKNSNDKTIPTLDTIQASIEHLPKRTQTKIQTLFMDRLMPRPCMSDDATTTPSFKEEASCEELICFFGGAWCFGFMFDIMMNWHKLRKEHQKTE